MIGVQLSTLALILFAASAQTQTPVVIPARPELQPSRAASDLPSESIIPKASRNEGVWTRVRTGSLANLRAAQLIDAQSAYVAGNRGILLHTTNAGETWRAIDLKTRDHFRDIFFLDKQHGWLLAEQGDEDFGSNTNARTSLLRTTDGGATWKRARLSNSNIHCLRIKFIDERTGFVTAEAGTIFFTRDAGETWARIKFATNQIFVDVSFPAAAKIQLLGTGGATLTSIDNGETWSENMIARRADLINKAGEANRFRASHFTDEKNGWAVGTNGNIFHTRNGGATWTRQISHTEETLTDVRFLDASRGFVCGARGTLLYTANGGATWRQMPNAVPYNLERFAHNQFAPAQLWTIGFGGTILKLDLSQLRPPATTLKN